MHDDNNGPNAHVELLPLWRFVLGRRDALLVLKALGGRLAEHEVAEASALCDRLTLQRAAAGRDFHNGLERAAEAVREKGQA